MRRTALFLRAVILVPILGLCFAPPAVASTGPSGASTVIAGRPSRGGSAPLPGAGAHAGPARQEVVRVASTPTTAPPNSSHRTRALIGYVLIGLVVVGWILVFVVRARRRRAWRAVTPHSMAQAPSAGMARPMPVPREVGRPREVGWHSDPDHMSEQAYWDGRSWTARRRWSGEAWVDLQQGPPT
jgi:hypothetical protein